MTDALTRSLASAIESARAERGLSVNRLAQQSGVSRAMISKIERGEAQPSAMLLGRLSGALGLTLTELIASAEGVAERVSRRDDQNVWIDPDTGYVRRAVSPPSSTDLQLIEVELPPGARVPMPVEAYLFIDQQMWVLDGRLRFHEGDEVHELDAGDCLQLGEPRACVFVNPTDSPCRYLVALRKR